MQSLNTALENIPKDRNGKISKEFLQVVLDAVAPAAGLPPLGAVDQVFCSLFTIFDFNVEFRVSELL